MPTCSARADAAAAHRLATSIWWRSVATAVASDSAATSPLALPTAASSPARASRRSSSDIPSWRASIARRACISSSSAARWRPTDPISANAARACSAASEAPVGSPSSRAAWARSSHASAVVARSPSAPSRRKASSASSSASADRPADSITSARDTSGSDASWPSRRNAWQFSSRIVSACGQLSEVRRRPTQVVAHLEGDELLTGVREQVVGLVEVGDGKAQLTPADVDPTPIGEHACEVDLGVPLAQAGDRGGEHLERLVDAPRPCAQHGALQAGGLLHRFRAEPFDVVEVGERGRHRRSESEDTGEREVGVGLGLGVADLLGGGDRRMQRRSERDRSRRAGVGPARGSPAPG